MKRIRRDFDAFWFPLAVYKSPSKGRNTKREKNYAETLLEFGEKRAREDGRGVSLETSDLSRSLRFEGLFSGSRQEVRPL